MVKHDGTYGSFWGCTEYPDCKGTVNIPVPGAPECPRCEAFMTKRSGSTGPFWGCSNFPDCRGTRNIDGDDAPATEEHKAKTKRNSVDYKERAEYFSKMFFDERQWWMRMVGEHFTYFGPKLRPIKGSDDEVKKKNTNCPCCGHKLEPHLKEGSPFKETETSKFETTDSEYTPQPVEDDIPF